MVNSCVSLRGDDLLKFGLIPEFIGRLPVIATLDDLDESALIEILTKPKNALVKQYKRLFEFDEVELTFEESSLIEIARQSIEKKTGARGLRSIIEKTLIDAMFEVPSDKDVCEVIVTEASVKGTDVPIIKYHEKKAKTAS